MSINWLLIIMIDNDRYDRWVFFGPSADWPRWWDNHSPNTITYSISSGEPLRSYRSTRSIRSVDRHNQFLLSRTAFNRIDRYDRQWVDRHNQLFNQIWRAPFDRIDRYDIRSTVSWSTQSTLTLKSPIRLYRSIRSTVSWSTQSTLALKRIKAFIYYLRWTL